VIQSLSPTSATAPANDNNAKLKSAAQAFEAVFLRQMIGSMRSAGLDDGVFDSSATQQFRDMSDARLADDMAAKGSFGIAEMLQRQLGPKVAPAPAPAAAAAAAAAK
jgi:flagellar protein FlgJ